LFYVQVADGTWVWPERLKKKAPKTNKAKGSRKGKKEEVKEEWEGGDDDGGDDNGDEDGEQVVGGGLKGAGNHKAQETLGEEAAFFREQAKKVPVVDSSASCDAHHCSAARGQLWLRSCGPRLWSNGGLCCASAVCKATATAKVAARAKAREDKEAAALALELALLDEFGDQLDDGGEADDGLKSDADALDLPEYEVKR
jgi:hypothetical protein